MNFTCIGFGAVIVVAGLLFAFGKLLPRAWKAMSGDEKAGIRIRPLCINIGVMIMLCGGLLLMRGLWAECPGQVFMFSMLGWFVACIADVVFIGKSKRYHNK